MIPRIHAQNCVAASLFAAVFAQSAHAQSPLDPWRGPDSQRCAVIDCTSTAPDKPEKDYVEPDTSEEDEAAAVAQRYNDINATANRIWASAQAATSPTVRLGLYAQALEQFRKQQAITDGPKVRNAIDQIETLYKWTEGVIEDQNKEYFDAYSHLSASIQRRPELFTEGNHNYAMAVFARYLESKPNASLALNDPSIVIPDRVLGAASDRVFLNAPPGVSDRVRKGFQAVTAKDWKVARAWFQDALNLDPQNPNLKSLIAILDEPPNSGRSVTQRYANVDAFGGQLPEKFPLQILKDNADRMTNGQIMNAFEDITDEYLRSLE